jgi:hypothetical protein
MNIRQVKKEVARISENWGYKNLYAVTRINKNKIEIRTELTSYDNCGGRDLQKGLEALENGWICENMGGCVYILYRPL